MLSIGHSEFICKPEYGLALFWTGKHKWNQKNILVFITIEFYKLFKCLPAYDISSNQLVHSNEIIQLDFPNKKCQS